jgi:hypothetical protein
MDKEKLKQAADRVFRDMAGAMTVGMAYVGTRTGLFRAMQGKGPLSAPEVISLSGMQPRYVEEWLKGMASAGYLKFDSSKNTFELDEEHAYFLASEGTDHFVGGMFEMVPPLMRVAPQVAQAFAKGGGVPFAEFGPDCVGALDLINRGQYEQRLGDYWLKSLPEATARLQAGGRALDVGCGSGRVCATLAKAFPSAEVVGVDPDEASIKRARAGSNAKFIVGTAADVQGQFDLITLCDCLHDLAAPVPTLQDVRKLLKPDGTLFIIEPKAADALQDNLNPVATMFYGFSIFHCMTQSLARGGPGLGTCMGPAQTEKLLRDAGFSRVEVLPIKSQVSLFYAARV